MISTLLKMTQKTCHSTADLYMTVQKLHFLDCLFIRHPVQLLDEVEQDTVIYQWRASRSIIDPINLDIFAIAEFTIIVLSYSLLFRVLFSSKHDKTLSEYCAKPAMFV